MGLGPLWISRAATEPAAPAPSADARAAAIAAMDWDVLRETVAGCTACGLCATRTLTVFGVGAEPPEWLVVGEAPGEDEDRTGEPFVGQAGKLLDAMLAAAGVSRRRNAFIVNVLKCRPPGNRNPAPAEIAACRPFLERQIALLQPKLIVVVGKVASHALLGGDASMASLHGRRHALTIDGRTYPLMATYHPSYLLRTPQDKAAAWADLVAAREIVDPG